LQIFALREAGEDAEREEGTGAGTYNSYHVLSTLQTFSTRNTTREEKKETFSSTLPLRSLHIFLLRIGDRRRPEMIEREWKSNWLWPRTDDAGRETERETQNAYHEEMPIVFIFQLKV
jgi:hypothetical protein